MGYASRQNKTERTPTGKPFVRSCGTAAGGLSFTPSSGGDMTTIWARLHMPKGKEDVISFQVSLIHSTPNTKEALLDFICQPWGNDRELQEKVISAIAQYLPMTQSYKMGKMFGEDTNTGYQINFHIYDDKNIACRMIASGKAEHIKQQADDWAAAHTSTHNINWERKV